MKTKGKITKTLQQVTGEMEVRVEVPEIEEYGDYSSNIAMVLAKKEKKNPRELAKDIADKLKEDRQFSKIVEKIEVAGPGFINFWLSKDILLNELQKVIKEGNKYGTTNLGKGKTVVIDYSSPNIAKRFGIGHLRSTIIGQAIYNLYSFLGYKVIGDNHLGDWGTQFGVLLRQITKYPAKQDPALQGKFQISNLTVDKLEELYIEFNKNAEENPKLWDEARAWFKKLEEGDSKARETWEKIVDISVREFDRIYDLLGVKIDYSHGESFYEDKMPAVISLLRKKGITKKSQGAEIVEFGPATAGLTPAMLVKKDGATTYYTRDLATLKHRIDEWNPDLIIYEVGSEQILHFRQIFATAKLLGWDKGRQLVHVAHGLIRFKSGKMSTRRGQTVKLEDVLDEAIGRANKIIEASVTSRGLSNKEKEDVAKAVGIGAVKYFDLMHHPTSDIIFDWEKMFVLEGNSAPYLQYTYARTQSVLRKFEALSTKLETNSNAQNLNDLNVSNFDIRISDLSAEELSILRAMVHFSEVIEDAANAYSPNLVCNYLFDLAQKFNAFYNKHRILEQESKRVEEQEDKRDFRVTLTSATGQILRNGLKILGIQVPERM